MRLSDHELLGVFHLVIHLRGVKIKEYYIYVLKIREIIRKDHQRVLKEGPKPVAKTVAGIL